VLACSQFGRDPHMLRAQYLENGWRYRLGSNGPPMGSGPLRFEWSRGWWRRVTQKGQGHDPNIVGAHHLDNGWRYGLGANEAAIGNCYLGIKWSRNRWRHVMVKGQGRDPNMLRVPYLVNSWRYRIGFNGPENRKWPRSITLDDIELLSVRIFERIARDFVDFRAKNS